MTNLRFCSTRLIPLDEMDGHRPGTLITRADTASCCVDVNSVPSVRCGFVSDRWGLSALMVACPALPISPKSLQGLRTRPPHSSAQCRVGLGRMWEPPRPPGRSPAHLRGPLAAARLSPTPCAEGWRMTDNRCALWYLPSCKVAATCHAPGPITDATTSQNPD